MTNWKNEIDAAVEKMVNEMKKAGFSQEKINLNKLTLDQIAETLKTDIDALGEYTVKLHYSSAKAYTAGIYCAAGLKADHGSKKHQVASALSKLM